MRAHPNIFAPPLPPPLLPQIHWFSIFNSFMMVIFLVGLVSMILMRTLRNDYARYGTTDQLDDMERDLGDEYVPHQAACFARVHAHAHPHTTLAPHTCLIPGQSPTRQQAPPFSSG